jgi:hyperosmotically inducible periplasmic protein
MKHLLNRNWIMIAALLFGLAGCAATNTHESTGEYIDDASITTKVKSAMVADKDVSALHISVETIRGVVHLSGTANTMEESNKATLIARNVAGVKAVDNNIKIK